MESSEGKSHGGNKGNNYGANPSQGLKPAEHLQSHTADVPHKATSGPARGTNPNPDSASLTNVVEKCPAPKQIYSFYFIKIPQYEDQEMKAEIQLAENNIRRKNQEYVQLKELQLTRSNQRILNNQSWPRYEEDWQYQEMSQSKVRDLRMPYAQLASSHPRNIRRKMSDSLCSSEEDLNCLIKGLSLRIQHESQTSVKERQLLREIKLLQETREKVIANCSPKAKVQLPLVSKNEIRHHAKMIVVDLPGANKGRRKIKRKFKSLVDEKRHMNKDIRFLDKELVALNQKRAAIYSRLLELRKKCEAWDALFNQNQAFLNFVKKLAARKDTVALRELSHLQVEKFMERLNSDKTFRDGCNKRRILPSLDGWQLSRDGRMQGPLDKPLVSEELTSLGLKKPLVTPMTEATKEEVICSPKLSNSNTSKFQKRRHCAINWDRSCCE